MSTTNTIKYIDQLTKALKQCIAAMKMVEENGLMDHLDSAPDGGDFWHKALRNAKKCLNHPSD